MENLTKLKMMDVKAQKRLLEVCPLDEGEKLTALYYDSNAKTFVAFYRHDGVESYFSTALNGDELSRLFVLGITPEIEKHTRAIRKIIQKNGINGIQINLNNDRSHIKLNIDDDAYDYDFKE